MNLTQPDRAQLTLALDAMGGDAGPAAVVAGAARAVEAGLTARLIFFGDEKTIAPLVKAESALSGVEIRHADGVVSMTDKPSQVLRRGQNTSMWAAIGAVKDGSAGAIVSCGNTGGLMALSIKQLGIIDGVDRPAMTALWPTPHGRTVVLDVGANVEATDTQLVQFAIMGEAFFRSLTGNEKPTIGLLNVGAEELKGHELVRSAARILREADPEMAFTGFIEGNDISKGTVDVVVTDGFTGNVALKTAEGAARLVGSWLKQALTASLITRVGALLLRVQLMRLKERMDPSSVNGAVFLGLNGLVVKSHGGADAAGVKSAIEMAASLASRPFRDEVAETIARVGKRAAETKTQEGASDVKAAAI
ncbi:MAG: phosphate acyltransferase PlsX [Pseudomonadota bacterium]|nr:phosphate acyltransferase PlsX [Pseudomonadota bacterium]